MTLESQIGHFGMNSNHNKVATQPEVPTPERREEAIALMLKALAILDAIGEHQAAAHLSSAIMDAGGDSPDPDWP